MKDILEGILNIIKSGFIVLGQKISNLVSSKKGDKHHNHKH